MKPHTRTAQTAEMFRPRLDEQLNMKHPLIRLAGLMDWELIEHHFAGHFSSGESVLAVLHWRDLLANRVAH